MRVEASKGKRRSKPWDGGGGGGGRGGDGGGMSSRGRGGSRKPFDPNDSCYECGERGHYAYDCPRRGGGGRTRRRRSSR